ncbi:hypothetical protein EJB05_17980 [Eragrostis curvula]|uniref:LisH domain-containing protein n=1 Tax=Eragrostis curvula TaxID=38414 RepID=A0A5J9VKG9_9POAL|nr:hypothetical protein EJB05_17980 [Eragrostis curvula]
MLVLNLNTSRNYAFFDRRLCARRILCFLKRHYLEGAAHELERETAVFFDLSHLQYLAKRARWEELTSYVTYFMPDLELRSSEACTFLRCIHIYLVLSWIAADSKKAQGIDTLFPLLDESAAKASPTAAAVHMFFHEVRRRQPRDFAAWLKIWEAAAERLKDLALSALSSKESCTCQNAHPSAGKLTFQECAESKGLIRRKSTNKKHVTSLVSLRRKSVAGTSGGDGKHGSEVEDNASKSEKRKMSAMLDTDTDIGTRLKARKGSSFAL